MLKDYGIEAVRYSPFCDAPDEKGLLSKLRKTFLINSLIVFNKFDVFHGVIEIGFLYGDEKKISTLKDDLNTFLNKSRTICYYIKMYNEFIRDYSLDCKNLLTHDYDYEVYRKNYGENNLRASFEKKGLKARQAQVFLVNRYIFEPKKSKNVFQQLFGNSLKKYNEVKNCIEEIYQDEVKIHARLGNDSLFCLFKKEMDDKLTKITTVKDIMDCSEASNGFVYLIDYSNKIWRIKLEDILKLSREVAPEELLQLVSEI